MAETKMQLAEWLDDLCVRFIINLPQEELESVERICFQVEEAQWFYEDFIRPLDPSLPSMNLRQFCLLIFQICPYLSEFSPDQHEAAYSQFLAYKTRVPVRGAILLNESMDEVLLVKGWKKNANWSFPRGKINKDEKDLDCAIREVYEETGFDVKAAGLMQDESKTKYLEVTMREQHMKLYVFRGVPRETIFQARTRKEISKISWYKLSSLPGYHKKKQPSKTNENSDSLSANKLYMVAPFLAPLKKWINQQKRLDAQRNGNLSVDPYLSAADGQLTEGDYGAEDDVQSDFPYSQNLQSFAREANSLSLAPAVGAADAAAQMKRLLGVGSSELQVSKQTAGPPAPDSSVDLLELLRSSSRVPVTANVPNTRPPQTPLEQIDQNIAVPASPQHHQYPRHISTTQLPPPPKLPLPSSSLMQQMQPNISASRPSDRFQRAQAPSGEALTENYGNLATQPLHPQQASLSTQPIRSQSHTMHSPRIGGPAFSHDRGMSIDGTPSATQPSQLPPPPKLNSQAMKLLGMFSNSPSTGAGQNHGRDDALIMSPNSGGNNTLKLDTRNVEPALQGNISEMAANPIRRPISRPSFGGLIPSVLSPATAKPAKRAEPQSPIPPSNNQQDNLLSLFRRPSESQATAASPAAASAQDRKEDLLNLFKQPAGGLPSMNQHNGPPRSPNVGHEPNPLLGLLNTNNRVSNERVSGSVGDQRPEPGRSESVIRVKGNDLLLSPTSEMSSTLKPLASPAELSATPAPFRTEAPKLQHASSESKPSANAPMVVPRILQRPQNAPRPEAESSLGATVSGPLKTPNLGSATSRGKSAKKSQSSTQRSMDMPKHPIQILKRPAEVSAPDTSRKSEQDVAHSDSPNTSGSPKKGFQPQILRRPKQMTPPSNKAKELVQPTAQESEAVAQKQSLLTLLAGSKQVDNPETSPKPLSPIETSQDLPASNARAEMDPVRGASVASQRSGFIRSRMNSLASTGGAESPGSRVQSGARTPISPADRGFLLNYLEGVVKGTPR